MTNDGKSEIDINIAQNSAGKINISQENKIFRGKHAITFRRKNRRVFLHGA